MLRPIRRVLAMEIFAERLVAVGDGFSAGGLVAEGAGGGGELSGTTLRVGSGNAGALRLLLLFAFAFAFEFSFALAAGVKSSSGSGDTSGLTCGLAFTLAGGAMVPPAGIPCSLLPVGVPAGCTG